MSALFFTSEVITDSRRRELSDNRFETLPSGVTHFEAAGPPDGPPVVFVHGLTTPMFIWDEQFDAFADRGYRVYRYDLLGRGLSDRPDVNYDADLYDRQLEEFLESVEPGRPVTLVGLSLGGVITARCAVRRPERVERLALVAPAGLAKQMPWWYSLLTAPWVAEVFFYGLAPAFFRYVGYRNLTTDPERRAKARELFRRQLDFAGYYRAILSTLRHGPVRCESEVYRSLGSLGCPVRAFWSRSDTVVPYRLRQRLESLVPRVEVRSVEEGEHTVNYDRPDAFNPWLAEVLNQDGGA